MPDLRTTADQLAAAHDAVAEARLNLHRDQERLAQLASAAGDTTTLREQVTRGNARLDELLSEVRARREQFAPFADPRANIEQMDASTPVLLFPLRMETRFVSAAGGPQLLVRLFPDDCLIDTFEPTMSESELTRVREFWIAWAAAGGVQEQERGAWRVLAGQFGSGRAAWLLHQHRPANLDALPRKDNPADVHLVVVVAQPLPAAEAAALDTYWRTVWRAGTDRSRFDSAYASLAASVGAERAAELVAGFRPQRLDAGDPSATVHTLFLQLPDPTTVPTQRQAWSQPATVNLLPERLVLLGFRDGAQVLNEIGTPIPTPLMVGPNPLADAAQQIRPADGDLDLGPDLAWLADFDAAVAVGMGMRITLSEADAAAGFDELVALGVRLSADATQGQTLVQNLFEHHQASAEGFELLSAGAATNNTETKSTDFRPVDPDTTFALGVGAAEPLRRSDNHLERSDSQWLSDALGIDLNTFEQTMRSRGRDLAEGRAMNRALWPATWGYFLDSMMDPVVGDATVELTRWFFGHTVSARGLAPAVRIGKQPYGILPTTAFERMQWLTDPTWTPPLSIPSPDGYRQFLTGLATLFGRLRADWRALSNDVAYVGRPGADPHQTLLDILGLSPTSGEYYRRWAESVAVLTNRLNLAGVGAPARNALATMQYPRSGMDLLAHLGYADAQIPEILRKFFLDAVPMTGDLIDDRPLSTVDPIRAWTPSGDNYIAWLRNAAAVSFDQIREQSGFIDGVAPTALLYLLLRYAVEQGFFGAGRRLLLDAGQLSAAQLKATRIDPTFIHVDTPPAGQPQPLSESRYDLMYHAAPDVPNQVVAQRVSALLTAHGNTAGLHDQLDALAVLQDVPTARLERVLAEHLDLASYRLDAWRWGLLHYQLAVLREGTAGQVRTGVYVGAFGYLHNVRRDPAVRTPIQIPTELAEDLMPPGAAPVYADSNNQGFLHAPSLNHAAAAAVLRNGYLSGLDLAGQGTLAVDLSSRRVRTAMEILDGLRNGQTLGALLGYRLERGLHDSHTIAEVDRFIAALRQQFPLVANKLNDTAAPGQPIEVVAARNVVDGLDLATHVRESGLLAYPFGKDLPPADSAQATAINTEVAALLDCFDALADLASSEAVYQAVLGNYGRLAGTLDAYGGLGTAPADPQVVQTPRTGTTLTHRVALHLTPGLAPDASPIPGMPVSLRAHAEPALNAWLASVLPHADEVTCLVDLTTPGGRTATHPVSQQDLALQPIDLLFGLDDAGTALDERIEDHVRHGAGLRPDATIAIRYRDAVPGKFSFFEITALVRSLRGLVLRSRPLRANDLSLVTDTATATATQSVDPQRVSVPLATLRALLEGDLTQLANEMSGPQASAEALAARYLALAAIAAQAGLPSAITGPVYQAQSRAYQAALEAIAKITARWHTRLTDFDHAVMAARTLSPSARLNALRRAERLVLRQYTDTQPANADAYEALLLGHREAFAAKTAQLDQILGIPPASAAGVLAAVAAVGSLADFDKDGIDTAAADAALTGLASTVADRVHALRTDLTQRTVAAADHLAADRATDAAKALFGEDFLLVPEIALASAQAADLSAAWTDRDQLLRHLTDGGVDFPVDEWLYGVARVRERMALWEHMMVTVEALGGTAPALTPMQLPHRPHDSWLGLQFPAEYDPSGGRLAYTAHFAAQANPPARLCGLLLDEWTEVLPAAEETSGLAFHFNRPNSEPPQVFLLALSPRISGAWRWPDLVDAVRDAFVEARMRAVEPAQLDTQAYARFLPAIIMAATARPITIGLNLSMNVSSTRVTND